MGTVAKALSLLNLFSLTRPEIGLSEIARLSGMNKATVYRMLSELQTQGLVEQTGPERAYRLGAGVLRLATLRESSVPLLDVAKPILTDLSIQTGETAHMSVISGTQLHLAAYAYSPAYATKVTMENAEDMPFHATASGLAILAYCDSDVIEEALAEPLKSYTTNTVTNRADILNLLEPIRATGLSESLGRYEAEVYSHAMAVFGPDRRPTGALAVAAPASRMTPETTAKIRAHLTDAVRSLTERTGGLLPDKHPLLQPA